MNIIKYPMKNKTDQPLFEYLVRDNMSMDYYLYANFDSALKQAEAMSISGNRHILIYEPHFNTVTREWHGCNTFSVVGGRVKYDKHAEVGLHLEHYVNAGEWLNPNQEWIDTIANIERKKRHLELIEMQWNGRIRDGMIEIEESNEWNGSGIRILHAGIYMDPENFFYGKIFGDFVYDDRMYQFRFHVHRPNQGTRVLSNRMDDVRELVYHDDRKHGSEYSYVTHEDTNLFSMAFWINTSDRYMETAAELAFRQLMKKVTAYSRANGLCQKLRKTDKKYQEWHKTRYGY